MARFPSTALTKVGATVFPLVIHGRSAPPSVEVMPRSTRVLLAAAALTITVGAAAAAVVTRTVGPRPDGTAITPLGMALTPLGEQTRLGDLPMSSALSPDGERLLVSNAGQGAQSLQLVNTGDHDVTQTLTFATPESVYVGVAWSPDGHTAYASAAANAKVRVLHYADGRLTEGSPLPLPTKTPDGQPITPFPAGLATTPDGTRLVVADQLADAVSVLDVATGKSQTVAVGHRPMWVTLSRDGKKAYVSAQGGTGVDVLELTETSPTVIGHIETGLHPNKSVLSPDGAHLYVANGDADTVSDVDTATGTVARQLSLAPSADAPIGSNPTGLALDPEHQRLFVTNSGNNDVAVVDLRKGRVDGLVPVAWYPTSVTYHDGRLEVTNGKGLGAGPNNGPGHPNPESPTPVSPDQYSGSMMVGTLSSFEVPEGKDLKTATKQVERNNAPAEAKGKIIPLKPGQTSPITHVIYVVKENRTYDQVLGSLGRGNGDPSLNLFGDESAPNTRELAKRFTTIDNFYSNAQVSTDGWNWVTQAAANPYVEQMWPNAYSGRKAPETATMQPENAASDPSSAHVWQRLDQAGVSFANYGFYVNRGGSSFNGDDPVLDAHTDHGYQGIDLNCPESSGTFAPKATNCLQPRIDHWINAFHGYEAAGQMPTVQFVRLGNDHTSGTKVGAPTPKALVADNDYAVGRLVDTVSHSPFWKSTAIFVTEDDAQNGPDHVDAHRTLALAISPYSQSGTVDSTLYSTASMVRTIGLLAGIAPLTQFDAYSTPMSGSFTDHPNPLPYSVIKPTYDMTTTNSASAPMAAQSAAQDPTKADEMDENLLNQAIWQSVRGTTDPMPTPQHHAIGAAVGAAPPNGDD